jgi:Co/Zn/Cd efflux system component
VPIFTYLNETDNQRRGDPKASGPRDRKVRVEFATGRILAALFVLALIFLAGVYCAHDAAMKDWSPPLLHTFELLLGGTVGIIVGEKTAAVP